MNVLKNKCWSFSNALIIIDYMCTISITFEWGRKSNKQWDQDTLTHLTTTKTTAFLTGMHSARETNMNKNTKVSTTYSVILSIFRTGIP